MRWDYKYGLSYQNLTDSDECRVEVEVEAKAYEAYLSLKADLEENAGIYVELDSARRTVAAQQDRPVGLTLLTKIGFLCWVT